MAQAPVKDLRGSAAANYQVVPTADLRSIEERVCEHRVAASVQDIRDRKVGGGLDSPARKRAVSLLSSVPRNGAP